MLPGTFLYVYLSASAANIKDNPAGIFISIGVLILFTLIISFIKRKQKILDGEKGND
jgi:uncharacterized membrane protein YdjX (TVP38/TMEM64 family)